MFVTTLAFLLLGYNVIIAISDCPKSQEWRNLKVSPRGPLVCARLYADSKCSGFPLLFGINSSSFDLGTDSSTALSDLANLFEDKIVESFGEHRMPAFVDDKSQVAHSVFVEARSGLKIKQRAYVCGQYHLLTPEVVKEYEHKDGRDYVIPIPDDPEVRQCKMREKWEEISLANIFARKIVESFGEDRMTSFLESVEVAKLAHSVFIEARSSVKIKQKAYVCGPYHLFTPEVLKTYT